LAKSLLSHTCLKSLRTYERILIRVRYHLIILFLSILSFSPPFFTLFISLVDLGSTVAFNAILSLSVVAVMFTYVLCIACILHKRLKHSETLLPAK